MYNSFFHNRAMKRWLHPNLHMTLFVVFFLLTSIPFLAQSQPFPSVDDAFLAGRLTSIFEREFGWPLETFRLTVHNGVATLILFEEHPDCHRQIDTLPPLPGLKAIHVEIDTSKASEGEASPEVCASYSFLGLKKDTIPFPTGDLFWPLIADPKQPQFFLSTRRYETPLVNANAAAVGYGETFGFFRRAGDKPNEGLQISVSAALFAQFNLDTPSFDLVNADYIIGFPLSYRKRRTSMRWRIYHQSSHLGDEFLLNAQPSRINLSFESFEYLVSHDWKKWRFYMGGEYMFSREPSVLKPSSFHGGIEYHGSTKGIRIGRWLGGIDVKSWEENDWSLDTSILVGIEFGARNPGQRRLKIMAEGYKGYAPHGQFYKDWITYYGFGMYLGF